ncbi:dnaJ homolog subfamily C member 22 isoform X2 [Larus michahellis]|uniref:dnaJ homolog subfamily C member 22 isoform X2 n=1 Tax=Larus michahellis TaxID=119627 RepID=UPI003D9B71AE
MAMACPLPAVVPGQSLAGGAVPPAARQGEGAGCRGCAGARRGGDPQGSPTEPVATVRGRMAKRLLVAYGLWALGGPLGLHHIYLGRDSHALLWMLTLGGFGAGWLWDFWHIPGWVATANGVGVARNRGGTVPALSPLRLAGQGWVLAVLLVSLAASVAAQRHRRYKPRGTPLPRLPARLYHLGLACLAFAAPLACRGLCGAAGVLGTLLALPRAATELLLLPLRAIRLLAETLGLAGDPPPQPPTTGFGARSWSQRQQWAYEVLGLPAGASAEDVHRSYRELVKVWHPDHNRQRAEEAQRRFIELQEAYEELGGPRRAAGG